MLLLFVSSHGVTAFPKEHRIPVAGTYELRTSGGENLKLQGVVWFESMNEPGENGQTYSVLKLQLDGLDIHSPHSMGFFVARQLKKEPLGTGTYEFNKDIDGFLAHFEGVFGFASINALGEQPYFARKGKLTIEHMGKDVLSGTLAVTMENTRGETLSVGGEFNATNKD